MTILPFHSQLPVGRPASGLRARDVTDASVLRRFASFTKAAICSYASGTRPWRI